MNRLKGWAFSVALALGMLAGNSAKAWEVLGTGTAALVTSDLTDPENDGDETQVYDPLTGEFAGFNATFFSSEESGFGRYLRVQRLRQHPGTRGR